MKARRLNEDEQARLSRFIADQLDQFGRDFSIISKLASSPFMIDKAGR